MTAVSEQPAAQDTPPGEGIVTPARLVMAIFFMHSLLLANWVPRIPDVAAALGLDHSQLAIGLVGMPVGTFIAIAVAGPLVERLTPRRTILTFFPLYCAAWVLPGIAFDVATLFIALMAIGVAFAFVDVAMNVEAARIQESLGRSIMSTCHGFWSVGLMAGALMGGQIAEFGVTTQWHLTIVGLATLPLTVLVARSLPVYRSAYRDDATVRPPVFALPSVALLGLCVFAASPVLLEGLARNWGGVFLRDVLAASPSEIGTAIAGFSLAMAAGRFLGNWATNRFGPVTVARFCGILATAGLGVIVVAASVPVATAGFIVMGLGVSVGFPLAVTAGAERGDRPAAINVAAMALFANIASLVGLTLVGFVAEDAGLRIGIGIALPVILASTLLAGELGKVVRLADGDRTAGNGS